MHTSTYTANLRDLEFVLFEHLPFQALLGQGAFAHVGEEDVRMILQAGVDFASDVVAPSNRSGDLTGCKIEDGHVQVPEHYREVWNAIKEAGWIGLVAPTELGGQALPKTIGTAIDELVIGSNPALHTYLGLCRAASNLLVHHASQELIDTYVPRLISGEWQGTMCLTEAGAGSDVGASLTRAIPVGDGSFSIKGTKIYITCGEHQLAENHIHLVLARLPDAPSGVKGLSLFLVPRFRPDAQGNFTVDNDVRASKVEEKLGIHSSPTCVMNFGDQDNCIGWLVGGENEGIKCMFHMMNEERIVVGLQGQALASAMYFNALKFAEERIQGSDISEGKRVTDKKVTIVNHPDVRRMLMTVKALAEGGRALMLATSLALDISETAEDEGARNEAAGRLALLTPICKAWGSDSGVEACSVALQVYGGSGYTADYPAEQYFRDARIAPIYEGTNGIQAIDLLFRKVLSGGGALLKGFSKEMSGWIGSHINHAQLAKEVGLLAKAGKQVAEVTAFLGARAQDDVKVAALGATPYLTVLGNVVVGYFLLQQAVIASAKLAELGAPTENAALAAWLENNASARFYASKVQTAKFFIHQILSQNEWKAQQILSGDRSALDVMF